MNAEQSTPDEVRLAWQAVEAAALGSSVKAIDVSSSPLALTLTLAGGSDLSESDLGRLRGYLHAVFGPVIPDVKFVQSAESDSGDWWQKKGGEPCS